MLNSEARADALNFALSAPGNALWGTTISSRQFAQTIDEASSAPNRGVRGTQVWGSYMGGINSLEGTETTAPADYKTNAYLAGIDTSMGVSSVGAVFGQSWGKITGDDVPDDIKQDGSRVGAYAHLGKKFIMGGSWNISVSGVYASDDNDFRSADTMAKWKNTCWAVDLTASGSYGVAIGSTLRPFIGLQWDRTTMKAFQTEGTNSVSYGKDKVSSLRGKAGLEYNQSLASKLSLRLSAGVLVDMDRINPKTIVDDLGNIRDTESTEPGKTSVRASGALFYSLTSSCAIGVGYTYEKAKNIQSQNIFASLNYVF